MSRRYYLIAIVACIALMPVVKGRSPSFGRLIAAQSASPEWTALTSRLERAALDEDLDALKAARLECLRSLAASPAPPPDRVAALRYTVAYAAWRLSFAPRVDRAEQVTLLDDAVTQLQAVTKAQPRDAETLGLLSAVTGAKIGKNPELGMTLGPASSEMLGRALAIDPNNPRLLVIQGTNQFHTPPEYGGSMSAAEATLRQALQRFGSEPADKPWPNWGRFDAHVWLGQTLAARNDKAGARAEYARALAIAPKNGWVTYSLLPAVR